MFRIVRSSVQIFCASAFALFSAVKCPASGPVPSEAGSGDDSVSADSIPALAALPDTVFRSVDALDYRIERIDTVTPGRLDCLEDRYAAVDGVLTFRGSPLRDMPRTGRISGRPSDVEVEWVFKTAYDTRESGYGVWGGGTGWTGQPLYVVWPDSLTARIRRTSSALTADFSGEEIVAGSLCGTVYFIDYATGRASRKAFDCGNPIKGTPSIDPALNGYLYVGQGVPCESPFGALVFDMHMHRQVDFFDRDPRAWRGWNAYDSSAVVAGEFLFRIGENGSIYKLVRKQDGVAFHSILRYKVRGRNAAGVESSMAVYRNYGYFADNHGNILCIDLDDLHPVWRYDNRDDTDASPVVEVESGRPVVYVGSELDKQGDEGYSFFTKIDGLTGERIWEQRIPCRKISYAGKKREGGMFATPLLGRGDCAGLIFSNFCGASPDQGTLIALDRQTGRIVYRTALQHYSWSSPVALCNEADEMFLFTGDVIGNVYLIEGRTGRILATKKIGWNFESSPVVIGDCIVVGSRGREIFKLRVK